MHISTARNITAKHSFSPGSESAPFELGAFAQHQKVVNMRVEETDTIKDQTSGNYVTADSSPSGNTVLIRDSVGNVSVAGTVNATSGSILTVADYQNLVVTNAYFDSVTLEWKFRVADNNASLIYLFPNAAGVPLIFQYWTSSGTGAAGDVITWISSDIIHTGLSSASLNGNAIIHAGTIGSQNVNYSNTSGISGNVQPNASYNYSIHHKTFTLSLNYDYLGAGIFYISGVSSESILINLLQANFNGAWKNIYDLKANPDTPQLVISDGSNFRIEWFITALTDVDVYEQLTV